MHNATISIAQQPVASMQATPLRCLRLSLYILVFLSLFSLGACHNNANTQAPSAAATPVFNVKVAQPLAQEVTEWDEYIGRIEAMHSVEVKARVSGYLEQVNFSAGSAVQKGQLLFSIDPRPYQAQLDVAKAELQRVKVRLAQAVKDQQRANHLWQEKAIAEEELEARRKDVQELAAAELSAQAQLRSAALNLEFTQIRAPISGRIGRELLTAGNLVNGGGNEATLLTTIVSSDPVYVYLDADEAAVLKYRRQALQQGKHNPNMQGTPLQLALSDEPGFPHSGTLDYVALREDTTTGTVALRGVFPNPDHLLSPGLFARIRIRASQAYSALLIPNQAIANDQAQRFVWVMTPEHTVEHRQVQLGTQFDGLRAVSQGLKLGEWVVIEGGQKLKPGVSVNPEEHTLSPNAGAH